MKITREEVQAVLNMVMDAGAVCAPGVHALVCETLARAVRALPTQQAVERDAKRSHKKRTAARTG